VEDQRVQPQQGSQNDHPGVHDVIPPKDIGDGSTAHASIETKNDLVPSDGKASTLRPRSGATMHRAYNAGATGHVAWFKRLWAHLTRRPQFTLAFLHLSRR
jgi:hypothetical protein